MHYFTVLRTRSVRSRNQEDWFLLRASGGRLAIFSIPNLCLSSHGTFCMCLSVSKLSPFFGKNSGRIELGAHLTSIPLSKVN